MTTMTERDKQMIKLGRALERKDILLEMRMFRIHASVKDDLEEELCEYLDERSRYDVELLKKRNQT